MSTDELRKQALKTAEAIQKVSSGEQLADVHEIVEASGSLAEAMIELDKRARDGDVPMEWRKWRRS